MEYREIGILNINSKNRTNSRISSIRTVDTITDFTNNLKKWRY